MTNGERLFAFFDAENRRDWAAYRGFLHPDVVWTLHGRFTSVFRGVEAYLERIRAACEDGGATFFCEALYGNDAGTRFAAILQNDAGERSCDIFEFLDGRIAAEDEFLLS